MIRKLRQKKGETLVETLVSMLIAVLSMAILSMATMTATNVNQEIREIDEKYNKELRQVESLDGSVKTSVQTLSLTFKSVDGTTVYDTDTVSVTVYGNDDASFISYDYTKSGGGAPAPAPVLEGEETP